MNQLKSHSSAAPAAAKRIQRRDTPASRKASSAGAYAAYRMAAAHRAAAARGEVILNQSLAKPVTEQPRSGGKTSRRVKPRRRFRMGGLLRSTVLLGMGVLIGACSIWHPHAVGGQLGYGQAASSGMKTKVFAHAKGTVSAFTAARGAAVISLPRDGGRWVKVQPGDTVWSLAERYGDPDQSVRDNVQDILGWNHLREDASLHAGRSIRVSG